MPIRTRYLVPSFTWASNYINLIDPKKIKLLEPVGFSNRVLTQHFRFDFVNNDSGSWIRSFVAGLIPMRAGRRATEKVPKLDHCNFSPFLSPE